MKKKKEQVKKLTWVCPDCDEKQTAIVESTVVMQNFVTNVTSGKSKRYRYYLSNEPDVFNDDVQYFCPGCKCQLDYEFVDKLRDKLNF